MEKLSKDCYAYPEKELYPVHTKEAALKSWQEFKKDIDNYSMDSLERIAGNFIKAAKVRDFQYTEELEQPAVAETITVNEGDVSVTFSKVASIQDVKNVVDTLNTSRETLSGAFMRKVAAAVYKDADELELEGEPMLKLARMAGIGICDPEDMLSEFRKRGGLIDMPQEASSKFYHAYRDLEGLEDKESLIKVATQMCDIMSEIDKLYKLASHYGKEIQAPEDVCFKYGFEDLIKEAEDYLRVPSTDTVLSKKALLEQKEAIKTFMEEKYGETAETDEDVLNKVASLSHSGLKALLQVLD